MAGFENNVLVAKNLNFDEAGAKPHLGIINTAGNLPIGTGNTQPSPEILSGSITSPLSTMTIGYSSPNITIDVNSSKFDLHVAKLIVNSSPNSGGNYLTIASALAAAVSGDTIFVMPGATGTYTENLTLKAGVNIVAFDADAQTPNVTIIGKMTATYTGTVSLSGLRFQTNGDYLLESTGATALNIYLVNCYLNATNANAIHSTNANASFFIYKCDGGCSTNTFFIFTGGHITVWWSLLQSAVTTTASTFTNDSSCNFNHSYIAIPVTTSNTVTFMADYCYWPILNAAVLTHGGSGIGSTISFCRIESGNATAISIGSTLQIVNCSIDSTNAVTISGAGTVKYGNIDFYGTSHSNAITTTTQIPLNALVPALPVTMPAGDYALVNSDYFVGATTSANRAITMPASPTTGETHRIKDITGTGATHNITIAGNGHNIDGSTPFIINTNYGSVDLVYNGTEWSVV